MMTTTTMALMNSPPPPPTYFLLLPVLRTRDCTLRVWNKRFASTDGDKNSNGGHPLHVVCCDSCVSLQAVKVLVNRQADALAVIDGEQGLLPFHFAASWGASLDVIFYLLQCHGGTPLSEQAVLRMEWLKPAVTIIINSKILVMVQPRRKRKRCTLAIAFTNMGFGK